MDSRAKSPILSIEENSPWVTIEQFSEKFEVYGYRGKKEPPEILERVTYAAAYDVPTGGTIILECHNGLGRKNHKNMSHLLPFMMIEAGWEVRDVVLKQCTEDRDPNQHCLILTSPGDQSDLMLDL